MNETNNKKTKTYTWAEVDRSPDGTFFSVNNGDGVLLRYRYITWWVCGSHAHPADLGWRRDHTYQRVDPMFEVAVGKISLTLDLTPIKKERVVVLNDKYSAVVSKDEIAVGCQRFPLSVARKLMDAVEKIQSES